MNKNPYLIIIFLTVCVFALVDIAGANYFGVSDLGQCLLDNEATPPKHYGVECGNSYCDTAVEEFSTEFEADSWLGITPGYNTWYYSITPFACARFLPNGCGLVSHAWGIAEATITGTSMRRIALWEKCLNKPKYTLYAIARCKSGTIVALDFITCDINNAETGTHVICGDSDLYHEIAKSGYGELGSVEFIISERCTITEEQKVSMCSGAGGNQCELDMSTDSDGDGVPDTTDRCPDTPPNTPVNDNGCSTSGTDSDGDGVPDSQDDCPNTWKGATVDTRGCATGNNPYHDDTDNDGVPNAYDNCGNTAPGIAVDSHGCPFNPLATQDSDHDGIPDSQDVEPYSTPYAPVDSQGKQVTGTAADPTPYYKAMDQWLAAIAGKQDTTNKLLEGVYKNTSKGGGSAGGTGGTGSGNGNGNGNGEGQQDYSGVLQDIDDKITVGNQRNTDQDTASESNYNTAHSAIDAANTDNTIPYDQIPEGAGEGIPDALENTENPLTAIFDGVFQNNPLYQYLTNSSLNVSGSCSFDIATTIYGRSMNIEFNGCPYADVLNLAGVAMVGITYLLGFILIFRR